jgi:hypothetical protein
MAEWLLERGGGWEGSKKGEGGREGGRRGRCFALKRIPILLPSLGTWGQTIVERIDTEKVPCQLKSRLLGLKSRLFGPENKIFHWKCIFSLSILFYNSASGVKLNPSWLLMQRNGTTASVIMRNLFQGFPFVFFMCHPWPEKMVMYFMELKALFFLVGGRLCI